jgi:hypothetical protein
VGVYAYCLGQAGHPEPPPLQGVEQAPVVAARIDDFVVWISELEKMPTPDLAAIRRHNAVVEAATEQETPLPFRFGQWFASRHELRDSLHDRHDQLTRQLRQVHGALEYGVRILDPAHQPPAADRSSGTAYLEALALRARQDQLDDERGREIAAALRAALGPLVRDHRVRTVGGGTIATIAHLVDRHDTGTYDVRVREFGTGWPELRFLFTGPWPPYGFMDERNG